MTERSFSTHIRVCPLMNDVREQVLNNAAKLIEDTLLNKKDIDRRVIDEIEEAIEEPATEAEAVSEEPAQEN